MKKLVRICELFFRTVILPTALAVWRGRDVRCRDEAGVFREIQYARPPGVSCPEFAEVSRRVRPRRAGRVVVVLLVTMVLFAFMGVTMTAGARWWPTLLLATPFVVLVLSLIYEMRGPIPSQVHEEAVRDAWIREGRCPACGFPLVAGSEAMCRCSECGGLWRGRRQVGK